MKPSRYRISVGKARRLVAQEATIADTESLPLSALLGRTLRQAVVTSDDVPPFDNSAMDGFAVRHADVPAGGTSLRITQTITAGEVPARVVGPGTCAAITTGAPIPRGADTVVPVEWTVPGFAQHVVIQRVPPPGRYVRRAGQDMRAGDEAVPSGVVITPPVVGMIAAAGLHAAQVSCVPQVGVVATGNEVFTGPGPLPEGQIRDINGPSLAAQIISAGAAVRGPWYARDDPQSMRATILKARALSDVVVISGGVSVGVRDVVKEVLHDVGLEMLFWRVRQRPGGPLAFGHLQRGPVFGLPGNPVSSAICFEQYVRPLLARMLGRRRICAARRTAVLTAPIHKKRGLHFFACGIYGIGPRNQLTVQETGLQASNLYSTLARADCLIHVDEDAEKLLPGAIVETEPLTWSAPEVPPPEATA